MPETAASGVATTSFIAYETATNPGFTIEPAPVRRAWMDEFPERAPYRCLPLSMANQAGWLVRSPFNFHVMWRGKRDVQSLQITCDDRLDPFETKLFGRAIQSHFGSGVMSVVLPWLFRTPPGIGLWVHGPANWPIDHVYPLEGLVETNWTHQTFTMNWKVMKRNSQIYFKKGDPLCALTPFPLDLLESLEPEIRSIESDPDLNARYTEAARERKSTLRKTATEGEVGFELHYMRGEVGDGARREDHRTKLKLGEFADNRPATG